MPERSVMHATFAVERTYDATPAGMFDGLCRSEAKIRWFGGPDDWDGPRELDFQRRRAGADQRRPEGGTIHIFDCHLPGHRAQSTHHLHL